MKNIYRLKNLLKVKYKKCLKKWVKPRNALL